jgi:hypothetical protein
MMTDPVFFVVEKTPLGEQASLYRGDPPQIKIVKVRIIYIVRVDTLPNANRWLKMSLNELYSAYCKVRDKKNLPPQYIPPALVKDEKPAIKFGHRESFYRGSGLPPEPLPTIEDLDRMAKKRRIQSRGHS